MFETPIIYVLFNRPELTRRTFAAVQKVRPHRLYLIADGPREHSPTDAARCAETRAVVESMLDWKCEVTRDYSTANLGCGRRLSSGLTSAFALLGEAIVLEDDVLPHPDFFAFCEGMLVRHRHDSHVHAISGFQPLDRYAPAQGLAVASTFNWIWGWASWQRSWKDYCFDLDAHWTQPGMRESIRSYVSDEFNFQWHAGNFDVLLKNGVDTWDFQWSYTLLAQRRVSLVSSVNLIENLGFDADATHTHRQSAYLRNLGIHETIRANRERPTNRPDQLHDRMFGQIIHAGSRGKIAALRFLARFPALARIALKH
ncbi:MAG: glycosyltransferase family A protein [Opitutaceae bacterium]